MDRTKGQWNYIKLPGIPARPNPGYWHLAMTATRNFGWLHTANKNSWPRLDVFHCCIRRVPHFGFVWDGYRRWSPIAPCTCKQPSQLTRCESNRGPPSNRTVHAKNRYIHSGHDICSPLIVEYPGSRQKRVEIRKEVDPGHGHYCKFRWMFDRRLLSKKRITECWHPPAHPNTQIRLSMFWTCFGND